MSDHDEILEHEKCDYDRCHCVPKVGTAVVRNRSVFCSAGCAEGRGCRHPECGCREAPPPE